MDIHAALKLVRDDQGRLKISNITCDANIAKMRAKFSGTLGSVRGLSLMIINYDLAPPRGAIKYNL